MVVLGDAKPKFCRFKMLKTLKKLALISRALPSPKKNFFPRLRSTARYFGPRNELRPTPGGNSDKPGCPAGPNAATVEKNFVPPPGKLLPVMNALFELSLPAPPK